MQPDAATADNERKAANTGNLSGGVMRRVLRTVILAILVVMEFNSSSGRACGELNLAQRIVLTLPDESIEVADYFAETRTLLLVTRKVAEAEACDLHTYRLQDDGRFEQQTRFTVKGQIKEVCGLPGEGRESSLVRIDLQNATETLLLDGAVYFSASTHRTEIAFSQVPDLTATIATGLPHFVVPGFNANAKRIAAARLSLGTRDFIHWVGCWSPSGDRYVAPVMFVLSAKFLDYRTRCDLRVVEIGDLAQDSLLPLVGEPVEVQAVTFAETESDSADRFLPIAFDATTERVLFFFVDPTTGVASVSLESSDISPIYGTMDRDAPPPEWHVRPGGHLISPDSRLLMVHAAPSGARNKPEASRPCLLDLRSSELREIPLSPGQPADAWVNAGWLSESVLIACLGGDVVELSIDE